MTQQDDLGLWNNLGTIQATIDRWQKPQRQATWERDIFRITFQGNLDDVVSFVWIRQEFLEGAVTPAKRYYPKPEPQLIELPIPADLRANRIGVRSLEFKQAERYTRSMGWNGFPPIPLKIEELAGY